MNGTIGRTWALVALVTLSFACSEGEQVAPSGTPVRVSARDVRDVVQVEDGRVWVLDGVGTWEVTGGGEGFGAFALPVPDGASAFSHGECTAGGCWLAGLDGVWRSSADRQTWTRVAPAAGYGFVVEAAGRLWMSIEGEVFRTGDGGLEEVPVGYGSGELLAGARAGGDGLLLAALLPGDAAEDLDPVTVYWTVGEGGARTAPVYDRQAGRPTALACPTSRVCLAAGPENLLLRISFEEGTVVPVAPFDATDSVDLRSIRCFDAERCLVGGRRLDAERNLNSPFLLSTEDGGLTFEAIPVYYQVEGPWEPSVEAIAGDPRLGATTLGLGGGMVLTVRP